MIHERFDIERWEQLFSIEKLRKEARDFVEAARNTSSEGYPNQSAVEAHVKLMSPGGEIVTSPLHLAVVEQLRAECLAKRPLPKLPTDVFVFAKGEPPDRRSTKVGGLPFWPKAKTWPVGNSGKPMGFVAQFCFAESTDLLDRLPGDILLMFADGAYRKDWEAEDTNALRFEWVKIADANLVQAADVPANRWDLYPVYGEIHRTFDYLIADIWDLSWWPILLKSSKSPSDFISGLGARRALQKAYHRAWNITTIEGTKIGGIPSWIQPAEDMPGRFICALGSVHPVYEIINTIPRPYPFTNVPGPLGRGRGIYRIADEEVKRDRLLMWDDVGTLYLFLDDAGAIHWTIQCY